MSADPPLHHSWLASDRPIPRRLARPLRYFLQREAAGGVILLVATIVALIVANSPFGESFEALWHIELGFSIGGFELTEDLRHWINDGLMAIFFFVVGLEIKRELVVGELNDARRAALPALAALGGMVVPALVYLAFNNSGEEAQGWGIPMATDIAFAVGVLALFSKRVPVGLKIFILSLAIVDDIGAILVIALFYSGGIATDWLIAAAVGLALVAGLRRLRVWWVPVYVVLGSFVWLATLESGVHATIAGVALGLLTPARPADPRGFEDVIVESRGLSAEPDAESLRRTVMQAQETVSVAERLEHLLHPWSSYIIIPLFALANAGLVLSADAIGEAATSPVTLGIALGLVAGKVVGIGLMTWLAIKTKIGTAPDGVTKRHFAGGAAVAGIGFTVSLFITGLAFEDAEIVSSAKMGVLAGSLAAGLLGAAILSTAPVGNDDEGADGTT